MGGRFFVGNFSLLVFFFKDLFLGDKINLVADSFCFGDFFCGQFFVQPSSWLLFYNDFFSECPVCYA